MINGFNYEIKEGITKKQIDQLIHFSKNDSLITQNTHDSKRFSDKNSFSEWLKKGRFVYSLTDSSGNLKGIAWFGIKPLPINFEEDSEFKYTFAIRIYADARGHGLSKPFMEAVFNKFTESTEFKNSKNKGFWLETKNSNVFAFNLYKNFGFNESGKYDDMTVMTYKV